MMNEWGTPPIETYQKAYEYAESLAKNASASIGGEFDIDRMVSQQEELYLRLKQPARKGWVII